MKLEDIKKGMTLWTVLTSDEDENPITQVIKGTVTETSTDMWPNYSCDWVWLGVPMNWMDFDPCEVYRTPQEAIEAYIGERVHVLVASTLAALGVDIWSKKGDNNA